MDLTYNSIYEAFRQDVRAFLAEHWPPSGAPQHSGRGDYKRTFRKLAVERGYLYRSVPRAYGGSEQSPDLLKAQIIQKEFLAVGAPMDEPGIGTSMLVPTLLECGTETQKQRFIPETLTGDIRWAQGYSEPNAGSDLASLRTRAELINDQWHINGQKIWSTLAQHAHYMFLLARTEPNVPNKYEGISYLLVDLRQPGVRVRPLKQITGSDEFCEVFFDDAKTPAEWLVGGRGEGWRVSKATLTYERSMIGGAESSVELFEKLLSLARKSHIDGVPALAHPIVRERLAVLAGEVQAHLYSSYRQLSMAAHGENPGVITLMNKLINTNISHKVAAIAQDLVGDALLLAPPTGSTRGAGPEKWNLRFFASLGLTIGGGTSNIQRNIIAERGLGLPREHNA